MTDIREDALTWTLRLARPAAGRLTLASMLGAAASGAAIGLVGTAAWLVSRASQHPPVAALGFAIAGVRFFGISRGFFRYGEKLVGHDAAFRVLGDVRAKVYDRLERLAPAGLRDFQRADLLARLVHDVDTLQDLLLRVLPPYAVALVGGVATVAYIAWMLPAAGLVLLVALVLAGGLTPWLTGYMAHRSEHRQAEARGQLMISVVDLLEGAPDLVAFGAAEDYLNRAAVADAELSRVAAATSRTTGIGSGFSVLLGGLAVWGALIVGIPAVRSGHLDAIALAVIALIPLATFELVAGLPSASQALERVRRSAARVGAVLEAPVPVTDPAEPKALLRGPHTLSVRGLRARYTSDGPWALDGVNLDLTPGKKVAIVGPSGAGKSTLAAVLLRLLAYGEPYGEGSVTLDGIEIADLDGQDVRSAVGLAAQDAHIFDTTLEENLRLGAPGASESELRDALDFVHLEGWVDELPDGLATAPGEYGARMSGGQRQRLALARALLAHFDILILDEPAEHIDTVTADAIIADLLDARPQDARRPSSILMVTHRLSGLDTVDEVIVLDNGRVIERGTHVELVAAGGRYAALLRQERRGFT